MIDLDSKVIKKNVGLTLDGKLMAKLKDYEKMVPHASFSGLCRTALDEYLTKVLDDSRAKNIEF